MPNCDGIEPDRAELFRCKVLRFESPPNDPGIEPERPVALNLRKVRFERLPRDEGIDPLRRLFSSRSRRVRNSRSPSLDGRVPSRLLLVISSLVTLPGTDCYW